MLTNVYVDGFNLYYGCLRGTPYKWLDLERLCTVMLPRNEIKRIRYFTAMASARDDLQTPVRQSTYLRALHTLPKVSVHLGDFRSDVVTMRRANPHPKGPKAIQVIKTEEKGSDVNLATYMLADAFRKDAHCFVLVTNDSDLVAPARVITHELGLPVGIVNPHPPKKRSRELVKCDPTFFKQIRRGGLAQSQFPDALSDQHGTITRPTGW